MDRGAWRAAVHGVMKSHGVMSLDNTLTLSFSFLICKIWIKVVT